MPDTAFAKPILLALAVFVLAPSVAEASCTDKPAPGVNWSKCTKTKVIMRGDELDEAKFQQADLSASTFSGSSLRQANFVRANLTRTSFREADLEGANLTKAFGQRTSFKGAKMAGSTLSKAEILRADFTGADLTDSDLSKAELSRADLVEATLDNVDLQHANLSRADFSGASLSGTDFLGAYMYLTRVEFADLSKAVNLTTQQLEISCGSDETMLPDGVERPESWPCGSDE